MTETRAINCSAESELSPSAAHDGGGCEITRYPFSFLLVRQLDLKFIMSVIRDSTNPGCCLSRFPSDKPPVVYFVSPISWMKGCNLESTTDVHEHNNRDGRTSRMSHVEDSKKVKHFLSNIKTCTYMYSRQSSPSRILQRLVLSSRVSPPAGGFQGRSNLSPFFGGSVVGAISFLSDSPLAFVSVSWKLSRLPTLLALPCVADSHHSSFEPVDLYSGLRLSA